MVCQWWSNAGFDIRLSAPELGPNLLQLPTPQHGPDIFFIFPLCKTPGIDILNH